ncbi:hypothetical protein [Lentibacillus sediminis]|uniref:hypothetical protein n=1 Tax=Lentibacillus sediminis TaxID=1940529 RepID=UPI0013046061|nr:hypothetical protein [Lentibacillus sediminis]
MHFHLDIYKSIVNDRMDQLLKEACGSRRVNKTKYVTDRKIKKNTLFRSFFDPGKG